MRNVSWQKNRPSACRAHDWVVKNPEEAQRLIKAELLEENEK